MSLHRIIYPALLAVMLVLTLLTTAGAYTLEEFTFDDPARTEQFRHLIGRLRCLVCQNESLAASQAGVAEDLRQQVYEMMRAGRGEREIVDYLVERYGDFVLYEPPFKPATYLLWFGPLLLTSAAAWLLVGVLRRQRSLPERPLSADEQTRLRQLTDESTGAARHPDREPS